MDTAIIAEKSTIQETAIQCELLLPHGHHRKTYAFDIADIRLRRRLVQRIYGLLVLQVACTMPWLRIMLEYPPPYPAAIVLFFYLMTMFLYTCFYVWRDWRRRAPYNYLVLLLGTALSSLNRSFYLIYVAKAHWLYAYPIILMAELLALMLYSAQERYRFTQARGIFIILLVFGMFTLMAYRLDLLFQIVYSMACTIEAWYVLYDTHFMLCGRHGYNIGDAEYVYAAGSIHIDLPKCVWRLLKMLILNKFVETFHLLRECFKAEVC
ncbi:uncharacterized protein LOC117584368 [Drosophila guanche]|uniref:Protein lifeguard 1 n=1 Tax=Drosophila guanche TaxID=7266 RepID=A0A3B0JQB9_DROGU|nr:uncharacterized protein LOC117584368 [Drosophila guanche]SPP75546.1 Hypothetical predicted protein [Drosophila guanche]